MVLLEKVAVCAEKYLQAAQHLSREFFLANDVSSPAHEETFGEMLRRERNNLLNGILGKGRTPAGGNAAPEWCFLLRARLRRSETIATLGMRETVRQLTQACEVRQEHPRPL